MENGSLAFGRGLGDALALRKGVALECPAGPDGRPGVLPTGDAAAALVIVRARDEAGGRDLALKVVGERVPGSGERELTDMFALALPERGVPRPAGGFQDVDRLGLLPPLYLCTEKRCLVPAVCPGCGGPDGAAAGPRCAACGAPGEGGGAEDPIDRLGERVRGGKPPATVDLPCLGCDRRDRCYAERPSGSEPTARDLLAPLSPVPWRGVLVEPPHLPFGAWARLAAGSPWSDVEPLLASAPAPLAGIVGRRLEGSAPPANGAGARLERIADVLDAIDALTAAIEAISVRVGHPHLGVSDRSVWFRLGAASEPADAIRLAEPMLCHVAPGWSPGADGTPTWSPPEWREDVWSPPGCRGGGAWLEGLGIASQGGTPDGERLEVAFLPHSKFESSPVQGDRLQLRLAREAAEGGPLTLTGSVSVGFREVCKIVLDPLGPDGDAVRGLLAGDRGGANVEVKPACNHDLADDLFAIGTLCLAAIISDPSDAAALAALRDGLVSAVRAMPADAEERDYHRELLRAAERSAAIAVPDEGAARGDVLAARERDAIGRALMLSTRLIGVLPDGYPGQGESAVDRERRAEAFAALRSAIAGLARELRVEAAGIRPSRGAEGRKSAGLLDETLRLRRRGEELELELEGLRTRADEVGSLREEIDRLREENAALRASPGAGGRTATVPGQGVSLKLLRELLLKYNPGKEINLDKEGLPSAGHVLYYLVQDLAQFASDYEIAINFFLMRLVGRDMGTVWGQMMTQEVRSRFRACLENKEGSIKTLRDSLKRNHKFFVDLNEAYLDALPKGMNGVLNQIEPQALLDSHKKMLGVDFKAAWHALTLKHNDLLNMDREELWERFLQPHMKARLGAYIKENG